MTAVATGTASGHLDLLSDLRDFATANTDLVTAGEEWAEDRWQLTGAEREWIAHGPGLAAADEIYCGIRTETDSGNDRYNWQLMGATGYMSGNLWSAQPGTCPVATTDGVRIYLWDGSIPYWFIGSGRRLIMVAKVSTVYQILYLGLALPYATPGQYPYPLVVAGCGAVQARRWSDTAAGHSAFFHPQTDSGGSALRMRQPDGSWPYSYEGGPFRLTPDRQGTDLTYWLREGPGDGRPLRAQVLATSSPARNVLGELDGIFQVPGFGAAAEDIVEIDGVDYLMVQNVHRTANISYCAVRLD